MPSIFFPGLVCSVTFSATWKAVPAGLPASTPPRSGATAAYISGASSVLLFGGYAEPEGGARDVTNDLLNYSQSSGWRLLQPPSSGGQQPGARLLRQRLRRAMSCSSLVAGTLKCLAVAA